MLFQSVACITEETLEKTKKELKEIREELAAWQYQCTSACDKLQQQKDVNLMMKREIIRLENEQKIAEKAAEETSRLRRRLKELKTYVTRNKQLLMFLSVLKVC